ncbi:MAG TPA: sigma-70 family RNA polymerase sigma factor [Candidatus Scatosoma pullistercoris]|uniref:RNA polymerase sigma factor SigS n=1 Tax=Candidatus Scatosoma pullistercoris TaxID=2840934 RepID=A0A9D1SHC2_9FIRM|nr:sigma-70 family RNA polymerase sigma factor [Candidatus Scatosoma pullistercoris]
MKAKQERLVPRQTDESLVERAQAGDKQATEELLSRYAGLVRGRARGFFLVGGETEDLIQEGMIGLYRAVSEYRVDREGGMSFKNFAYLCVSRRIIDAVKASARKKNVPLNNYVSLFQSEWEMPVSSPEDEVIRGEDRREFLQKMSKELSDFEFRVTVMYMDGLSCAEICEATGKEEKSVDNAIQRSKKKLQKLLKR